LSSRFAREKNEEGRSDGARKLADLVTRFTEAFNVRIWTASCLQAEDAVYDEFNARSNRGTAAIRAAFVPQFRGDYGKLRFTPRISSSTRPAGKAL